MGIDRDVVAFGLGMPIGGLSAALLRAEPTARRVGAVSAVVLFAAAAWLLGLGRLIEAVSDVVDRLASFPYFMTGLGAGAVIVLASWPRSSRPPTGGKTS